MPEPHDDLPDDPTPQRRGAAPAWIIAFVVLALIVVGGATYFASHDRADPVNTAERRSDEPLVTSDTPTSDATTATPEPTDGPFAPDAQETYQVDGRPADSLPAYKGSSPATNGPLGLGCGGDYPTILYKTETRLYRTSMCSTTPSGEDIRMVAEPKAGGAARDMAAEYVPGLDSFVARGGGRKYVVEAYDGTLTVSKGGQVETREESLDYQSLDNEPDGD